MRATSIGLECQPLPDSAKTPLAPRTYVVVGEALQRRSFLCPHHTGRLTGGRERHIIPALSGSKIVVD
jgi:hypothetical protein